MSESEHSQPSATTYSKEYFARVGALIQRTEEMLSEYYANYEVEARTA